MKNRSKNDARKSVGRCGENIQKPANVISIRGINSYGVNQTPRQEAIDTEAKKHRSGE